MSGKDPKDDLDDLPFLGDSLEPEQPGSGNVDDAHASQSGSSSETNPTGLTGADTGVLGDLPLGVEAPGASQDDPFLEQSIEASMAPMDPVEAPPAPLPDSSPDSGFEMNIPAEAIAEASAQATSDSQEADPAFETPFEMPTAPVAASASSLGETRNHALDAARELSDSIAIGKPAVAASFPFTLRIEGSLEDYEKERLLDIVEKHQFGIDVADLKPQVEAGHIMLPRISEYAGVLIIQALRSARAKMTLLPSDSEDSQSQGIHGYETSHSKVISHQDTHPAESLPILRLSDGEKRAWNAIDTFLVSSALKTSFVEAERSKEYQELLETLKLELKYKAHRKGATALSDFQIVLTPLGLPSSYRLTLTATGLKSASRA